MSKPTFLTAITHYVRGPGRIRGLYAFRSVIDAGARTTLGTDFPVEGVRPTLVTHPMDVGLLPEQMMTRLGALRGSHIRFPLVLT